MDLNAVLGGMLGLAAGDALGVPVEFMSRASLEKNPVTDMRAFGTHDQPAGTWSDDTSMALCLMDSLTHGLNYEDMMERFLRWAETGYMTAHGEVFDMGLATRSALVQYAHGKPALSCGGAGEYNNGNGSLMRILPMAFYLHEVIGPDFPEKAEAYEAIHRASMVTHAHPVSQMACGLYCSIANALLCGGSVQDGIELARAFYRTQPVFSPYLESKFKRVDTSVLLSLPREAVNSSGYVVDTLEAALRCVVRFCGYRDCLLEAVNLGNDTDTVGAAAGGLAGLRSGLAGIPGEWLSVLAKREEIEELCGKFYRSLCGTRR